MNLWQRIIKSLKAQGYKGDETLEAVKAFVADAANGVELVGSDGAAIDIEAAFKAKDEGADTKSATKIVLDSIQNEDLELLRAAKAAKAAEARGKARPPTADADDKTPQRFNVGNSERKAYAAKIATAGVGNGKFQAKFADVDTAEVSAAMIRKAILGNADYAQKKNDTDIVTKAQVEYSNTLGGYTVPQEFVSNLIWLTEPYGTARKIANVRRMTREVQQHPRKTSIPTMAWAAEATSTTVADNAYDLVELTAKKLQLIMQASNELLEDSAISIADDIATSIREAYDKAIDNAYFLGDGTSTYGGFSGLVNALPSSAYFNASGAWSAFTTGDFNLALGRLENVDMSRVAIVCSRQAYHQICMRLEKATSQFKPLVEGRSADGSFLGFPVYFSQLLPTATASGAKTIYVGDFVGATMLGDRRDLSIMSSEHSAFTTDSIQWRATARASVAIHGDGRGSTYGPIVCLKSQ